MSQSTSAPAKSNAFEGGHSPFKVSYSKIMIWIFLLSDAFTFSAFLISYGSIRYASAVWPDPNKVFASFPFMGHTNLPLMFVSLMTFILILSSVTMVLAVHAGHCKDKKGVVKWLIWTILGGIAFLSCQAWEWTHLHHQGAWWNTFNDFAADKSVYQNFFTPSAYAGATEVQLSQATNNFFNFFFSITGFHGLHVTTGVIFNIMILFNTINNTYEKRGHYEMVEKIGLYWHFVDLVWVFVFTSFYLLF